MITDEEVDTYVIEHDKYVQEHGRVWRAIRMAYADRFWEGVTTGAAGDGTARPDRKIMSDYPIRIEVNHLRSWVFSYADALFHQGLRATVRPPTLPRGKVETVLGPEIEQHALNEPLTGQDIPPVPTEKIAELVNVWLDLVQIEDQTERAFILGLMYPEFALKMGCRGDKRDNVVEDVWMDVIPPWEALFDRRSRTADQMRFIGHIYWAPIEEVMGRFDIPEADLSPVMAPDVLEEGERRNMRTNAIGDQKYIRILEFYDNTAEWTATDGEKTEGEYRVYILEGLKNKMEKKKPIYSGPVPYDKTSGKPLPPIQCVNFISIPEYPLMGIAPAYQQYLLNSETNYIHTFMVNAARRDASRVLLLLKSKFNKENIAKLTGGSDMTIVEIEDEGALLSQVATWLEQQPVSSTLLQVFTMLEQARDKTSLTSPMARGEAVKYATAAEIHSLNSFTETTLGRIARKMNAALVRFIALFFRVLAAEMDDREEKKIRMIVNNKEVVVERKLLDEDWDVAIVDTANTPMGEAEKRRDHQMIYPVLMELYAVAKTGDAMAIELLNYTVDLYNLPASMGFDVLVAREPAPPEPEPAPGALPPGAAPGPMGPQGGGGDAEALMGAMAASQPEGVV